MSRSGSLNWTGHILSRIHILWEALKKFYADSGFFLSSGLTFSLLICLIPIISLLSAFLGTYVYGDREVIRHIRHYFQHVIPPPDTEVIRGILRIIRAHRIGGILGIAGLIWASTWVFSSIRTAFNVIFRTEKDWGILKGKAVDLLMILLAGLFLLLSMVLTSMIDYFQAHSFKSLLEIGPLLRLSLKYLIPFFFTFWMFFWIFKIVPNKKIYFKPALLAALFASLFWEVAKQLFGWYVFHLRDFSVMYGSLSSLVIFFLWAYYSSAILILGGEVAYLLEQGRNNVRR